MQTLECDLAVILVDTMLEQVCSSNCVGIHLEPTLYVQTLQSPKVNRQAGSQNILASPAVPRRLCRMGNSLKRASTQVLNSSSNSTKQCGATLSSTCTPKPDPAVNLKARSSAAAIRVDCGHRRHTIPSNLTSKTERPRASRTPDTSPEAQQSHYGVLRSTTGMSAFQDPGRCDVSNLNRLYYFEEHLPTSRTSFS